MHNLSRRNAVRLVLLVAASAFAPLVPSVAAEGESVPLAIKGYDPVAYFTIGGPVHGLPKIEYEWDEYRYRFSRPEHRELFKADPVRYAPQFASFCANALARGKIVEANPEYWLIREDKLYIFAGPAGLKHFQQDLAKNIAKANQNRALTLKR
jgi:hypothetical protein